MYTYSAGSPGTFGTLGAPRPIDVMGPGYGLAPGAEGGVVRSGKSWSGVRNQFRLPPGYHGGMGTYLQMDHKLSYAPRFGEEAAAGSSWVDAINATIAGTAAIFQMSTQAKLQKQAQHQAERDAAHRRELEKTQALYLASGSVVPAQGSVVTVAAPGTGLGSGRMMAMAGVAAVGLGALYFLRKGRRRR